MVQVSMVQLGVLIPLLFLVLGGYSYYQQRITLRRFVVAVLISLVFGVYLIYSDGFLF